MSSKSSKHRLNLGSMTSLDIFQNINIYSNAPDTAGFNLANIQGPHMYNKSLNCNFCPTQNKAPQNHDNGSPGSIPQKIHSMRHIRRSPQTKSPQLRIPSGPKTLLTFISLPRTRHSTGIYSPFRPQIHPRF